MSFGEHLDELRKVLIRCAIAVAVCSVFGFYYSSQVVEFLTRPLQNAMTEYQNALDLKRMTASEGFVDPELLPWMKENHLSPKTTYIDPGDLFQILEEVAPGLLDSIEFQPFGFTASDLDPEKARDLCLSWVNDREDDSPRGKRLAFMWEKLSPDRQQSIQAIAKDESKSTTADQRAALADAMNDVAAEPLFQQAEFAALMQPAPMTAWSWLNPAQPNPLTAIREQLEKSPNAELSARLNRVLISSQFSAYMPAARTNLRPLRMWVDIDVQPQSLQAMEPFMIWLKAGLVTALLISSPVVFYFLWSFVAAGLYPHEQKYVYIFLPISLFLFFSGASLAFFFAFKPVLDFLFAFNAQMGITPQLRINEWMSFVLFLPIGFGIAFQLPLVMLFLNRINVFTVSAYLSKWRVAIMVIFVLSMILTPSDPISMILLAIPLTGLYFIGIALCHWLPRKENPFGSPAIES